MSATARCPLLCSQMSSPEAPRSRCALSTQALHPARESKPFPGFSVSVCMPCRGSVKSYSAAPCLSQHVSCYFTADHSKRLSSDGHVMEKGKCCSSYF